MALVNAWWQRKGPDSEESDRCAWLACDACTPPWVEGGTETDMRDRGWEFDHLESGTHICPWCLRRPRGGAPRRRSPAQKHPALPNLLVIGAGRCGTTSLHRYLLLHPEIHMSEIKEPRILQLPWAQEMLDAYATLFDGDAPVRGESSPIYTHHPVLPGVPERVRAALPNVKLIYLLGDPVERAISSYTAKYGGLKPIDEAFGDPEDPYNRYVAPGKYAMQLERYAKLFPSAQLLVIDQTDLLNRRRETLSRVFRFLGVDPDFDSRRFDKLHNTSDNAMRLTGAGWWLRRNRFADSLRSALPPAGRKALLDPVKRLTSRRVEPEVVPSRLREGLRRVYRTDAERLREMTGQEFASWQI